MGYVYCAGCGMDALGAPNRAALVFCPYCEEYFARIESLRDADAAFYRQEQEDEERDSAITDAHDALQDAKEELKDYLDAHNGRCHSCEAMMIQGVYCHEAGCPAQGKITSLRSQLERMENE
jgi:predicted AlkP superfamily phosphohydrolase/phosphomutase